MKNKNQKQEGKKKTFAQRIIRGGFKSLDSLSLTFNNNKLYIQVKRINGKMFHQKWNESMILSRKEMYSLYTFLRRIYEKPE
jgi:hypothetical protein